MDEKQAVNYLAKRGYSISSSYERGKYILSRKKPGTHLFLTNQEIIDLAEYLKRRTTLDNYNPARNPVGVAPLARVQPGGILSNPDYRFRYTAYVRASGKDYSEAHNNARKIIEPIIYSASLSLDDIDIKDDDGKWRSLTYEEIYPKSNPVSSMPQILLAVLALASLKLLNR